MLTFDNVEFFYKKSEPILHNIQFTIERGQFVAIVGANGCGKSTIAKLMNGLVLPKKGTVRLGQLQTDQSADVASIRQKIGFIFQNPDDQFITTTVRDELIFGLENIRVPREEMDARVERAIRAVGMEDFLQAMPHELSGGQKQRVAIAAILAMQPELFIFDEATSMLDPEGRAQVLSILHTLHGQGMTVVHITHHMDEVLAADRVLLLADGHIAFDGTPTQLFSTVELGKYHLVKPFAVKLHELSNGVIPLAVNWKEAVRTWATN